MRRPAVYGVGHAASQVLVADQAGIAPDERRVDGCAVALERLPQRARDAQVVQRDDAARIGRPPRVLAELRAHREQTRAVSEQQRPRLEIAADADASEVVGDDRLREDESRRRRLDGSRVQIQLRRLKNA